MTGTDGHVVRLIREMRVLAVKARSLEEAAHQEATATKSSPASFQPRINGHLLLRPRDFLAHPETARS